MTICCSCGRETEIATGWCARCGTGQPGALVVTAGPSVTADPESAELPDAEVADRVDPQDEIAVEALAEVETPRVAVPQAEAAAADADIADVASPQAAVAETEIANHRAAEAGPAKGREGAEDENLRRMFSARLIRPNRLNSPLKRLMWIAMIQIALVAVLMAAQKVHQPQVGTAVQDPMGGDFAVPLVVFVGMTVSVAAGYWFGLAGALRVRTIVGAPVAALATWMLADYPIALLRAGSTSIGRVSFSGLLWAQLGVLGAFWVWLAWVAVARWRGRTTGPVVQADPDGKPWQRLVFLGTGGCVLAYYALEFAIWVQFLRAGQTAGGTGFVLDDFGLQAVLLPTFLILVVLLGSTDLLEWGEITVRWVVLRAGRAWSPWLLMIATSLAAIAILANAIRQDGVNVLLELAVIGIPAVLIGALVWLAPGYGGWSGDIRSRAVTTGATVIFAYSVILVSITSAVLGELGWPSRFDLRAYWLVSTPVGLAALTAGVLILARGALEPEQRGRVLLLVIAGVVIVAAGLPGFLAAAWLPAVLPTQHFVLLNGVLFVAAAGTLIEITGLAVLGRLKSAGGLLANTFKLLIGLQLVRLLLDLLQVIARLGANSDYLLAGLFFLTVLWGFVISGDKLTGTKANSAKYPRDGRILLTVSYTLISSATLLYLGALHGPTRASAPPSNLTSDLSTPLGLSVLGSALVIVAFVTRLRRVPGEPAGRVARLAQRFPAWVRIPSAGAVQVAVAVIGTVLTALSVAAVATAGFPDLARASAAQLGRSYVAPIPGPDCDAGGAIWDVASGERVSTWCGHSGLVETVAPHRAGDVSFLPPGGFTSPNYRISVTVRFSDRFDGCAAIYTRGSAAGRYENYLCSDNSAAIDALNTRGVPLKSLAVGFSQPAPSYTMKTVSDGAHQSFFVNGTKISAIVNKEFSVTVNVGLFLFNLGRSAGSAIFSHFTFTLLPGSPHT
jgi:hypothetical protein